MVNWYKKYNAEKLLVIGIVLILCTFYYSIPTIWTSKSDLSELKGTLRSANTYVTTVENINERTGYKSKSQKAELIFYINEYNKKFQIFENIGNNFRDEKYEAILQGLKRTDSISVWIKKTEIGEFAPEVFQITNNKETLLEYEKVRLKNSPMVVFTLSLGLISIASYFWIMYPRKFKKAMGIDEITS